MKILVVDDEPRMRSTLRDILESEGFDVTLAGDGNEALALCGQDRFDVVLMDVRMPGLDGVSTFRMLRQNDPDTRVIMMSAFGQDTLKQAALEEGAIAFLDKPLDVEKVLGLIRDASDPAILVVGDPQLSKDMQSAFAAQSRSVTIAHSAHEALSLVEQIRFDVIFIDAVLPVMNGLELYLAIKKITPTSIAVMVSGLDEEAQSIGREAVRRTAYTWIPKPVDPARLVELLGRIHRQRSSNALRKPDLEEGQG